MAPFLQALAAPEDRPFAAAPAEFLGCQFNEAAHALLAARGDHKILGTLLLQHAPLHLHIVAGVAPIP